MCIRCCVCFFRIVLFSHAFRPRLGSLGFLGLQLRPFTMGANFCCCCCSCSPFFERFGVFVVLSTKQAQSSLIVCKGSACCVIPRPLCPSIWVNCAPIIKFTVHKLCVSATNVKCPIPLIQKDKKFPFALALAACTRM